MPRWKTTENIFKNGLEFFNEDWMNYQTIQYPKTKIWDNKRAMSIEDVDIWEIIVEKSGGVGVYAAWLPYAEYYIVIKNFSLAAEFFGENANRDLERFLIKERIYYPKNNKDNYSIHELQDANFFKNGI
jgi:hypothetical protein